MQRLFCLFRHESVRLNQAGCKTDKQQYKQEDRQDYSDSQGFDCTIGIALVLDQEYHPGSQRQKYSADQNKDNDLENKGAGHYVYPGQVWKRIILNSNMNTCKQLEPVSTLRKPRLFGHCNAIRRKC